MFLKNKNIIFKIRRSNVTDYAALMKTICCFHHVFLKQFYTIFKVNFVTLSTIFAVSHDRCFLYS